MQKDHMYRKRWRAAAKRHSEAHFKDRQKLNALKFMINAFPEIFERILNAIGDESHPQPDQRCPQRQALSRSWAKIGLGYAMLEKLLLSMHEALAQLQRPSAAVDLKGAVLDPVPTSPVSRTEAHFLAAESRKHMRAVGDLREVLKEVEYGEILCRRRA